VTEILVTDPGAPEPRVTLDIDAVVEVTTRREYYGFADKLHAAGFSEDRSEGAPLCRWLVDGAKVDLMPPDEAVLGFSNRWYSVALANASVICLPHGTQVRVVTAPYFVATKLEAFAGRGRNDFTASHDIEDFIAVVDGRPELLQEIRSAPDDVRRYVSEQIRSYLDTSTFLDAIPGHLPPDDASQRRAPLLIQRLTALADASEAPHGP
jgi:hypothetical protein